MAKSGRRRFITALGLGAAALASGAWYQYFSYRKAKKGGTTFSGATTNLADLQHTEPFDVCIIGSGPAGAVLGYDVASRGLRVLIIESGLSIDKYGTDDRLAQLDHYENDGKVEYPLAGTYVRAVGGTSNIWTGRCARLHPSDFSENAYTPANNPWPLSYEDIAPWYDLAERTLNVKGGALSEYHAPRSFPLPDDSQDVTGLRKLLSKAGLTIDPAPTSRADHGGPVRAAGDLLPKFVRLPGGHLVSGATVTRLIANSGGTVTHVEVRGLDRSLHKIRAKQFVLAAGAVNTARLMLLSRSERFPNGIGNQGGHVGHWFMEHPNLSFRGHIPHNPDTLSPKYELGRSHQFYDRFKEMGLGSPIFVFMQSWVYPDDLKSFSLDKIAKRLLKAELHISASLEMEPQYANKVSLSKTKKDYFGDPVPVISVGFSEKDEATMRAAKAKVHEIFTALGSTDVVELPLTWSHHHIGTCRMGVDPKTSVIDPRLKVHGCRNLYVLSSAAFVTSGASHPTLAITAFAHRLGRDLLDFHRNMV